MEFIFRVTPYDGPGLDGETAELLRQRLEARSRRVMPGMWKATDKLNAREKVSGQALEKRRRRYRVWGSLMLAVGAFALVTGLMEPKAPSLIGAGVFSVFCGLFEFRLARAKTPGPPAPCRKEAQKLLAGRRAVDWDRNPAEVRFDDTGLTVSAGENRETVSLGEITGAFETEHLWLVVYSGERALLLQRKDLVSGAAAAFLPYLQGKIAEGRTP